VAVETIIDEHIVREIIPRLKAAGAEGIIEYPLTKSYIDRRTTVLGLNNHYMGSLKETPEIKNQQT